MIIEIKKFNELTINELYELLKLRAEVFIVEQKCIFNDIDDKDLKSIHIMIKTNNKIEAYLRVLEPGVSYSNSSVGRVLVAKDSRKNGLARKIVKEGINYIINNFQNKNITIGAQEYLKDFYESLGFKAISQVYLEDGIPHLDMVYITI